LNIEGYDENGGTNEDKNKDLEAGTPAPSSAGTVIGDRVPAPPIANRRSSK
jgi:hypothetical protein